MNRALARPFPVLLLAVPLLVAGCGGLDEVDITRSTTATIPAGPPGGTGTLAGIASIDVSAGATLRQEGIDPDDVDSARLRRLTVEVLSGASLETFARSVQLTVRSPGLPDQVVASKSGIESLPAGTRTLELDVASGVDLKPYVVAETATLTIDAAGSAPAQATEIRATATVRLDVNVSGLLD